MFEVEKAKIKQAISGCVYDMLKENKCILAGGAITSLMCGREVNDYDLYFTTQSGLDNVVANVFGVTEEEHLGAFDLIANHVTERSFLAKDKRNKTELQFIHYKVYDNVKEIFNSFDFHACMGAFDFSTEEFVFHENFFKDNSQRTLTFNKNTDFPIVSALRVDKYCKKGYKISKKEMLRVLFAVVSKNYNSWETVISEIGGLYGITPEELFNTDVPFSIDAVIDQLGNTMSLEEKAYPARSYSFEQVVDTMYNAFSDNFKSWYDGLKVNKHSRIERKHDAALENKYDSEIEYEIPDQAIKQEWYKQN